jgi:hypothetical protein
MYLPQLISDNPSGEDSLNLPYTFGDPSRSFPTESSRNCRGERASHSGSGIDDGLLIVSLYAQVGIKNVR